MKRKLFSILLLLAMVVTMIPAMTMTAFADQTSNVTVVVAERSFTYFSDASNPVVIPNDDIQPGTKIRSINAKNGAVVEVTGNIEGTEDYGIQVNNAKIKVIGNVTGKYGISATGGANVEVTEAVKGTEKNGIYADGATVEVNGNVKGNTYGVSAKNNATVTVNGDAEGISNIGTWAQGENTKITVGGDVTGKTYGISAREGAKITASGKVNGEYGIYAISGSAVQVSGSVEGTAKDSIYAEGATVKVDTNVKGKLCGVNATGEKTEVTVGGDVTSNTSHGVAAKEGAKVTVTGNVIGGDSKGTGVTASGATVIVKKNVTGCDYGICVGEGAEVNVDGNVTGTTGNGIFADGGTAQKAKATIGGDASGSYGVNATNGAVVKVKGNATGYTEKTWSIGVNANKGAKVTVDGNVSGKQKGVAADGSDTEITVIGNAEGDWGIYATTGAEVKVTGKVNGTTENGIYATGEKTEVTVGGNVEGNKSGVSAYTDATVNIEGSVTGTKIGVYAANCIAVNVGAGISAGEDGVQAMGKAHVTVNGNVTSTGAAGVVAYEGTVVVVTGKVSGKSGISNSGKVYLGKQDCQIQSGDDKIFYLFGLADDSAAWSDLEVSGNALASETISVSNKDYKELVSANQITGKTLSLKPVDEKKELSIDQNTLPDGVTMTSENGAINLSFDSKFNGGLQNLDVKITVPVLHNVTAQVQGSHGTAALNIGDAEATTTSQALKDTSIVFTATPETGYAFDYWEVVSGGNVLSETSTDANYKGKNPVTVTMPDTALTLKAHFKAVVPTSYKIIVEDDGHGTAVANPTSAAPNASVTLTATPNDGYAFKEWKIERGLESGAITENAFTMPANEVKVKAIFEKLYTVIVEANGHGSACADVTSGISGKEVNLTINPETGYEVDQIYVVRGGVSVNDKKFTIGTADVKIQVTFKAIAPGDYGIIVEDDGHGTASANPTSAAPNANVTLTATPNEGYAFKEWKIERGLNEGDISADNTFTMPANEVKVKAVFEKEYAVEVEAGGHGSASADVQKGVSGKAVNLTITPDNGYEVDQITVVRGGVTVTNKKFNIGTADVKIKVTFKEIAPESYNIIVEDDGHGTAKAQVSSSDVTSAAPKAVVTLTATPNEGYAFKEWKIERGLNEGDISADNTFTMPANEVKVKAIFERAYNINLQNDGHGTAVAKIGDTEVTSAASGKSITLVPQATEGYEFEKWEIVSGDFEINDNGFTMPETNVTIRATFKVVEAGKHSIIVKDNGYGTAFAKVKGQRATTAEQGDIVTLVAIPKCGYEFDKWIVINNTVEIKDNSFNMPDSDVTVYAVFKKIGGCHPIVPIDPIVPVEKYYTVHFDMQGIGSAIADVKVKAGACVAMPTTPVAEGYEFGGWFKEDSCINAWNFAADTVTKDTTLYAKWTSKDDITSALVKASKVNLIKAIPYKNGKIKLTFKNLKLENGVKVVNYQVYRSTSKKFNKNLKKANFKRTADTKTYTWTNVNKLKKGTKYYYKVRGKVKLSDGTYVYTKWSNVKSAKCKKTR